MKKVFKISIVVTCLLAINCSAQTATTPAHNLQVSFAGSAPGVISAMSANIGSGISVFDLADSTSYPKVISCEMTVSTGGTGIETTCSGPFTSKQKDLLSKTKSGSRIIFTNIVVKFENGTTTKIKIAVYKVK